MGYQKNWEEEPTEDCDNVFFKLILFYIIRRIIIYIRIIYCLNLLMIIPTLQKNTITEIIYLTLMCVDIPT